MSVLEIDRYESVTLLTMNRPEVRNAVDDELMNALRAALLACENDGTRCIVLTGANGSFSSGADIKKAIENGYTPENTFYMLTEVYGPTLKTIRLSSWPVIAAVDGFAAGIGCDMALACDIRLVSERAKFAELFIRVGLIPDGGGTYLLPRLVGTGRAMEMMFTGRDVDANEAVQIGLANHSYPTETFMDEVLKFATVISKKSPQALRRGKAAMLAALDSDYAASLAREADSQKEILSSDDGPEGFMAFAQKREPIWKGR